ncbi:MAG: YkgJ family cysteine cluster protein [Candidatus Competibacteraceae bacterium]
MKKSIHEIDEAESIDAEDTADRQYHCELSHSEASFDKGRVMAQSQDSLETMRREVAEGIAYLHSRIGAATARTFEAASFIYALIELLEEKGNLNIQELDERKKVVAKRLGNRFAAFDGGVAIQESNYDKYTVPQQVEIDCASRINQCKALCCKMVFPLARQDIEEGIIHWELSRPYVIAKGSDGYCHHLDRENLRCTVHARRPLPCRVYDCRQDRRIWLDFERRIVNTEIDDPSWPQNMNTAEIAGGDGL